MRWYGVVKCFSRFDEWVSKVYADLNTNDIKVAGAYLVELAYFTKEQADRSLKEARAGVVEHIDEVDSDCNQFFKKEFVKNMIGDEEECWSRGEEWIAGISKDYSQAEKMFIEAIIKEANKETSIAWTNGTEDVKLEG